MLSKKRVEALWKEARGSMAAPMEKTGRVFRFARLVEAAALTSFLQTTSVHSDGGRLREDISARARRAKEAAQ